MTPDDLRKEAEAWIIGWRGGRYSYDTESKLTDLLTRIHQAGVRDGMEKAEKIVRAVYPRGSAHTYASENADRYIEQEETCERCADVIKEALNDTYRALVEIWTKTKLPKNGKAK